jgi:hypothetical protein
LDGSTTPWDGQGFGFLGEVTQAMVTTVTFPGTAFHAIMNSRCKTSDYIVTHLDEIGARGLPPSQANDPESTLVSTRQFMYLPAKYVPLMLSPSGYTLRQAWDLLYPVLVDTNALADCQPLVTWLRASTTGTTVPNNANKVGPSRLTVDLQPPLADTALLLHRSKILNQALPALFQPSATLEMAITQMAVAVTQQTNEHRVTREQKMADATAPKLPSDKFNITINILQEFLEVPDERNLPDLWHQWANCSKRQELIVFSDLLTSYARGPESFSVSTPIPTSKVVQDLLSFAFVGVVYPNRIDGMLYILIWVEWNPGIQ